ncbi:MAG TPA: YdcF family protein [Terriglobia bacterium]|nr:YdcF family protein [Terriglobia bacterium]
MTVKRVGRRLSIFLVILALMAGAAFLAFRNVGRWLVDPDALQHARAIVVLSGNSPFRVMEATEIYRQGWAPEVWLLQDETTAADEAFAKLGIPHPTEQDYDQQVLERLGVPKQAIRILEPPTTNTASEIRLIADELRRQGGDKAILVTSPVHTRRSKFIWHVVVGDHPQAILRYDSSEPSDPDHWWRATQDIQDVGHEILGLIDARLGFVAKPRKR